MLYHTHKACNDGGGDFAQCVANDSRALGSLLPPGQYELPRARTNCPGLERKTAGREGRREVNTRSWTRILEAAPLRARNGKPVADVSYTPVAVIDGNRVIFGALFLERLDIKAVARGSRELPLRWGLPSGGWFD